MGQANCCVFGNNCCVFGKYEGLYFIDYDDIHVFRHKDCDLDGSAEARFLRDLDYGELTGGDWMWISRSQKAILESPLFYLCLEDNNWSLAVELIQKEPPQGRSYAALQARCYQRYLTGIARCLLNHLPGVGLYTGPWTSARLRREELSA